jgi:hypothetical protein
MTTTVTTPPAGSPVLPGVPFPLGATPGRHRVPGRRPHLQPCTVPARTVWIIDTTDSPGTVDDQFHPLVNGSTRDFVHPMGWTTPQGPPGHRSGCDTCTAAATPSSTGGSGGTYFGVLA